MDDWPTGDLNKDSGNIDSPFTSLALLSNRLVTAQTDRARVGTGDKEMDNEEIKRLEEPLLPEETIILGETQSRSKLSRSICIGNESSRVNFES